MPVTKLLILGILICLLHLASGAPVQQTDMHESATLAKRSQMVHLVLAHEFDYVDAEITDAFPTIDCVPISRITERPFTGNKGLSSIMILGGISYCTLFENPACSVGDGKSRPGFRAIQIARSQSNLFWAKPALASAPPIHFDNLATAVRCVK